jgi:hypothetical protein
MSLQNRGAGGLLPFTVDTHLRRRDFPIGESKVVKRRGND